MAANLVGKAAFGVAKSTGSFLVGQVKNQMVSMIESYEPTLEAGLRAQLTKLRVSNPAEAAAFVQNWKKLDRAVVESLSAPAPAASSPGRSFLNRMNTLGRGRSKRTKRHSRK